MILHLKYTSEVHYIVYMVTKLNTENEINFERSLGFLIHDVARLMRLAFDRMVRDDGLTRAQWMVMGHLVREDGQTQTSLAANIDMEKAPTGRLIERLEQGGWVVRRQDLADKRANRVYKTSKVDPLISVMQEVTAELYKTALNGLEDSAQQRLIDDLIIIKENLQASRACEQQTSSE